MKKILHNLSIIYKNSWLIFRYFQKNYLTFQVNVFMKLLKTENVYDFRSFSATLDLDSRGCMQFQSDAL